MNESLRSTSEKDCRDGGAHPRSASGEASPVVRKYNTFHHQTLTEMVAWLTSEGVTHVTMEATGIYWKPIFHAVCEAEQPVEVLLVNARHDAPMVCQAAVRWRFAWCGGPMRCR